MGRGNSGISGGKQNKRVEEDIKGTPLIFGTAIITDNYIDIDGYSNKKTEAGALKDLAKALDKYDKGEADALRDSLRFNEAVEIKPEKGTSGVQYILEWEQVPSAARYNKADEIEYKPANWYLHTRILR